MTSLYRVRTALTGFSGGPGVSTMYFLDVATAQASVHAFWSALVNKLPRNLRINVETGGDIISDVTGEIVGAWPGEPTSEIQGAGDSEVAAPVGAQVPWVTSTILDGKRLKGRTFLVPIPSSTFTAGGVVNDGAVTMYHNAAVALIAEQETSFVVWHRPRLKPITTKSGKVLPAHDGGHGLITSSPTSNKAVVLRSRRD